MLNCPTCEALPRPIIIRGKLFISAPLGHTESKLISAIQERNIAFERPMPNVLSIDASQSRDLLASLPGVLSEKELVDSRCMISESTSELTLADAFAMKSLRTLVANVRGQWLFGMLEEDRLVSYFQPICDCLDPTNVFAYECLLRGREPDGGLVPPDRLYQLARELGLVFHLDRAARLQHIRAVHGAGISTNIFINFNPTAIYDPEYCLQSTVELIRETGIPERRFVFEVVESDESDLDRLTTILTFYRERGFRVALDDFGAGYGSVNLLSRLRPNIVKLDRELARGIDRDKYKSQIVSHILRMARDVGVEVVLEGIETEGEWQWAIEHHVNYVQGFLFAKPSPTPTVPSLDWLALTPA